MGGLRQEDEAKSRQGPHSPYPSFLEGERHDSFCQGLILISFTAWGLFGGLVCGGGWGGGEGKVVREGSMGASLLFGGGRQLGESSCARKTQVKKKWRRYKGPGMVKEKLKTERSGPKQYFIRGGELKGPLKDFGGKKKNQPYMEKSPSGLSRKLLGCDSLMRRYGQ